MTSCPLSPTASRRKQTGRTWDRPRRTSATSKDGTASPGGAVFDEPRTYNVPDPLQLNQWALAGDWTIEQRASVLNKADGRIAFRFHSHDVHLVLRGASRARPCHSACSWTRSLLVTPMGSMLTSRAMER